MRCREWRRSRSAAAAGPPPAGPFGAPLCAALAAAALAAAALGCGAREEARSGDWFEEVSRQAGITFVHQDGRSGAKFYVETTASGGGWLDFDGDGDLDLYLLDGAATPGSRLSGTPRNALYENRGGGRFVDVTAAAGVGDAGYGMGFCAGDVDADGRLDFLVTNFGPDRLFHNLGGGRFEEVGEAAGVADPRWSSSCAFGDLDGDGDLDLYVTHYLDFAFDRNPFCGDRHTGHRSYCRPNVFSGLVDSLFVNSGGGRFHEEGAARGIVQDPTDEKGLGVVLSDLDGDGDLDVYVANDGTANRLYLNDGGGRFTDVALPRGAAVNELGTAESSMGVAVGDVDGDGWMDVVLSHYSLQTNTLYRNLRGSDFADATAASGLGPPSYRQVGWGLELFDYDDDGDLDLAVANGHVEDDVESFEPELRYREANQLYENLGDGTFRERTAEAGAAWRPAKVSRGLAVGDFDDDGRLDLLVTNTDEGIDLLANRLATGNHWLGLELAGPPSNPFAIGALVWLEAGGRRQVREVRSGGSFQSQSDLRPHFGLGREEGPVRVEIRWPDGRRQTETVAEVDRYVRIDYRGR